MVQLDLLPSSLLLVALVGIVPIYLTLFSVHRAKERFSGRSQQFAASLALGAMLFFLVDLVNASTGFGIDLGLTGGVVQLTMLSSLALGLFFPYGSTHFLASRAESGASLNGLSVGFLFAFGIGFHSLGEGIVIGYDLLSGYGFTLIQRVMQGLSFSLHKLAEGLIISIPLLTVARLRRRDVALVGLPVSLPVLLGTVVGFLGAPGILSSYFFAVGAGSAIYILAKLVARAFSGAEGFLQYVGIFVGILYMFFAGLLHSIPF